MLKCFYVILVCLLLSAGKASAQPQFSSSESKKITVEFNDADIDAVMRFFSEILHENIVVEPSVIGRVTTSFKDVTPDQALSSILALKGLYREKRGNVNVIRSLHDN